ncbi:hypothetical protein K1W69_24040 [Hoeflea sp. WL0058]|uniref:Uncharacterized protein n=1 Tax=Flavimaribacter sediminis TaxID=2865987 RepID=A0AAE2ZQH6_9HYPH|nr:hypothetical protein [Flavimaribacter sediminis]MBW8640286.1 hypothetical protein [Flavimaribacter sediminis]
MLFEMVGQNYFEIVLRDGDGSAYYGDWLAGSQPVEVTDEIINGFRVIFTGQGDEKVRHEYEPGSGYGPIYGTSAIPLASAKRMLNRKAS